MSRLVALLVCLLFLAAAHKDKKTQNFQVYTPFDDVPKPDIQNFIPQVNDIQDEKKVHDHENLPENQQQQYQQFNEMLQYGLIFGTMLLACLLMKTCAVKGRRSNQSVNMVIAQNPQNRMTRVPILNKALTNQQIRNRIQWHKFQIKRLEEESKFLQTAELRRLQQKKRQQQSLKAYYNQIQLNENIQQKMHYNNIYSQPCYYESIPVGRPIPKDNDSSFASEYPTL